MHAMMCSANVYMHVIMSSANVYMHVMMCSANVYMHVIMRAAFWATAFIHTSCIHACRRTHILHTCIQELAALDKTAPQRIHTPYIHTCIQELAALDRTSPQTWCIHTPYIHTCMHTGIGSFG
jgi:hypothetical protein